MGANCCVATRHKALPHRTHTHRDVRYSPSWSFQWDNRACVEDVSVDPPRFSNGNNRNVGSEIKHSIDTEIGGLSDGGSALDSSETPKWHQSPVYAGTSGASKGGMEGPPLWHSGRRKRRKGRAGVADGGNGSRVMATVDQTMVEDDSFIRSNSSPEGMEHMEPATESSQRPNASRYTISLPSSAVRGDPSTSRSYSLPADPTSSRNVWRSPGYQLSRQISDSQIPACKSVNEKNSAEGRQSDLPAGESHGRSSDGWSMRMFSELVASSQRERWSFDSEYTACSYGKITRSNSHPLVSSSVADLHTCGICSKLLKERSSWSRVSNELSVVAVLVCGHVYHADCLETLTTETHRYDPSCPVCIDGEKYPLETSGKGKTSIKGRSKISRNAVADIDLDGISITERRKSAERESKVSKLGSISSFKSFGRPFLRRHFSLSSRPMRPPPSENEQTRKKGFWGRYRK